MPLLCASGAIATYAENNAANAAGASTTATCVSARSSAIPTSMHLSLSKLSCNLMCLQLQLNTNPVATWTKKQVAFEYKIKKLLVCILNSYSHTTWFAFKLQLVSYPSCNFDAHSTATEYNMCWTECVSINKFIMSSQVHLNTRWIATSFVFKWQLVSHSVVYENESVSCEYNTHYNLT